MSDVVLAFPQIVLALVFVSIVGPKLWLIVLVVAISQSPRVARLVRSMTFELMSAISARLAQGLRRAGEAAGAAVIVNHSTKG